MQRWRTNHVCYRRSAILHFSFPSGGARSLGLQSLVFDYKRTYVGKGVASRTRVQLHVRKGKHIKGVGSLDPRLNRKDRRVGEPEPLVKKCFPRGPLESTGRVNHLGMQRNNEGYKLINNLQIKLKR